MNPRVLDPSRVLAGLIATAALLAFGVAAAPAGAATGSGEAVIRPAGHDKGRTLSGQGVKILAGAGATAAGGNLNLPIGELEPGAAPSARSAATLSFKKGAKTVALTNLSFDLTAGTLIGELGGTRMPVFRLGAAPAVNSTAGSISLKEGALRLTGEAAKVLRRQLELPRALVNKGVGMLWLSAQAAPTHAAAQPVVSGSLNWGVLASWRKYVLGNFGPGSVGTITTAGGATTNGSPAEASSYFGFPNASGSFRKGLYGAADLLNLRTAGSVTFAKPGHCIIQVTFSAIDIRIDGADSGITLDSVSNIDEPAGMSCVDKPTLDSFAVPFATLGLGTPTYAGNTVTWSALPATLTAAGATAWNAGAAYAAGKVLDPVTITVGLG